MKKVFTVRTAKEAGKVFNELVPLILKTEFIEMVYRYRNLPEPVWQPQRVRTIRSGRRPIRVRYAPVDRKIHELCIRLDLVSPKLPHKCRIANPKRPV